MNEMTTKERWNAAMRMEPVDRLPYWPKLGGTYAQYRSGKFSKMTNAELQQWIGADVHGWVGSCTKITRKNTTVETSGSNGTQSTSYVTPSGTLELIQRFDKSTMSWHPVKFPVSNVEEIRIMTEFFADETVELDEEAVAASEKQYEEIGETMFSATGIGTTPLMNWVEHFAGVEMAHYLLMDHQEEVETLFDTVQSNLRDTAIIVSENTPADAIYIMENTSTTLISPSQYRTYCYKHVGECVDIHKKNGKATILHMCGHLKELLPDLNELQVEAFEAFTSPTLGNTTLLDGRTKCPNTCLIGGTNAMLWTKPTDQIIAKIEHDLDELPHHRGIVVTSAGVMPPTCEPETIKEVCDWVKAYPVRA